MRSRIDFHTAHWRQRRPEWRRRAVCTRDAIRRWLTTRVCHQLNEVYSKQRRSPSPFAPLPLRAPPPPPPLSLLLRRKWRAEAYSSLSSLVLRATATTMSLLELFQRENWVAAIHSRSALLTHLCRDSARRCSTRSPSLTCLRVYAVIHLVSRKKRSNTLLTRIPHDLQLAVFAAVSTLLSTHCKRREARWVVRSDSNSKLEWRA
mmetsp:Transcript_39194/g.100415  ORF Transcript_39194/g.100415 Transcript_39194/m.100415 type:complete len:205 (-) Transcript_39194:412-1026(-)